MIGKTSAGRADIADRCLRLVAERSQVALDLRQGLVEARDGAFGNFGCFAMCRTKSVEQIDQLRALGLAGGRQRTVLLADLFADDGK